MDYQIVEKPAFEIFGKAKRVSTKDGENMRVIPAFWQESMAGGLFGQLMSTSRHDGIFDDAVLGVCTDFAADLSEFTYLIAAEKGAAAVAEDFTVVSVAPLTWAIFHSKGAMPEAIQNVWGYVMGEFFKTSGYEHGHGPDVEVYGPGDPSSADYTFEVWVPVVKK